VGISWYIRTKIAITGYPLKKMQPFLVCFEGLRNKNGSSLVDDSAGNLPACDWCVFNSGDIKWHKHIAEPRDETNRMVFFNGMTSVEPKPQFLSAKHGMYPSAKKWIQNTKVLASWCFQLIWMSFMKKQDMYGDGNRGRNKTYAIICLYIAIENGHL
jgi:hypothetical protein